VERAGALPASATATARRRRYGAPTAPRGSTLAATGAVGRAHGARLRRELRRPRWASVAGTQVALGERSGYPGRACELTAPSSPHSSSGSRAHSPVFPAPRSQLARSASPPPRPSSSSRASDTYLAPPAIDLPCPPRRVKRRMLASVVRVPHRISTTCQRPTPRRSIPPPSYGDAAPPVGVGCARCDGY
jgi:hypothetical protein